MVSSHHNIVQLCWNGVTGTMIAFIEKHFSFLNIRFNQPVLIQSITSIFDSSTMHVTVLLIAVVADTSMH